LQKHDRGCVAAPGEFNARDDRQIRVFERRSAA